MYTVNCKLLLSSQVTIPNREPKKLCGRESPGLIATNSNIVKLDYHTDQEGLSHGWSLDYSTHSEDTGRQSGGVTAEISQRSLNYN